MPATIWGKHTDEESVGWVVVRFSISTPTLEFKNSKFSAVLPLKIEISLCITPIIV